MPLCASGIDRLTGRYHVCVPVCVRVRVCVCVSPRHVILRVGTVVCEREL